MATKLEALYDDELVSKDLSGNIKIALKAKDHVMEVFERYRDAREFRRGGRYIDIARNWDRYYRFYKCIYIPADHSYHGTSQAFIPELRKAVNTIESELSNALFSRDDYFSVDSSGHTQNSIDMSREAYSTMKYFSNQESYVDHYELAVKQLLIYGLTAVETIYDKTKITGPYGTKIETPLTDPATGEPLIDPETGQPLTDSEYRIIDVDEDKPTVKIEVRDIYRLYINHLTNDPASDDIVYRDLMSTQKLLELAERGVYNKSAVRELLKNNPTYGSTPTQDIDSSGEGRTLLEEFRNRGGGDHESLDSYEVLRFQGRFTVKDETSGKVLKENFWIDIGERHHVLRVIKSPLIGGNGKTFSLTNLDNLNEEFYGDSILSPFIDLNVAINDFSNQSIDSATYSLNAPLFVPNSSRIKASDLIQSRKQHNRIIYTNSPDRITKLEVNPPLQHLNYEMTRLQNSISSGTGATSLASGSPTGTQVDRSGKAVDALLNQSRSQFSRYLRKIERNLITPSLQKVWDVLLQFVDDEYLIDVSNDDGTYSSKSQSPAEIVGRYRIRVDGGSQFIKERQSRDQILVLLSIAGISDNFMQQLDSTGMLREIANSLSPKLARFINPENLINQQSQLIQQLQQALEAVGNQNADLFAESKRLEGELKQTDRSNRVSPSPVEQAEGFVNT